MGTEQYEQKLELCFTEYETLQRLHIRIIETEPMPDLVRMTEDRDLVFNKLKQNLDKFVGNAGSNGKTNNLSILTKYQERLNSIMSVNEKLSKTIEKYRDKLKINLGKMRQSKTAMRGYKAANLS